MNGELLSAALAMIRAGVSIIPIDHRNKRPAANLLPGGKWKPYQERIAREDEVRRWFSGPQGAYAFAVVCGRVSGGLLVLDFDAPGFCERWAEVVGDLADGLPVQQTGGGGYQVFVRCPEPGGNDKLAWTPDESEQTGRTIAIETRGEGGYAVVAPSLHPTGNRYRWLHEQLTAANVPSVTQEHAGKLLAAARALDEAPLMRQEQERLEAQARESHRQRQVHRTGQGSVIDAFNQAHSVEALLERHGYAKGPRGRYIRPGGRSESVSVKDSRSCHWSSDDPLNDGRGKGGCGCHDAFDLFCHFDHGGDVGRAVKAAADLLGMRSAPAAQPSRPAAGEADHWLDPLPLPPGLPPVMPFDYELLPDPLRPWVRDIADRMQCPPDFIASTAMIVAGSLIGRKVAIRPKRYDDWQVVPNLYGANVGRPSLMKSPAMQEVMKYPAKREIEAKVQYAAALAEHEAAALVAEETKRVRKEQIRQALKEGGDAAALAKELSRQASDPPTRRRYLVNDTTVEKLGMILAENENGVLIFVDELVSFLRTMEREGHEGDRGFYLTAWAGNSRYTYDRIGRGTLDIEAAIVSVIGSIQPGVLNEYLRAAVCGGAGDDGLMQRFQMTVWPDMPATWQNVDRSPDPDAKAAAYAALDRLAELTPLMVEAERDSVARDALPFLRFDYAAQELFDAWRVELETRLRSGVEHPTMEAHLAKYRSLIPSLALIIHLADGGVGPVSKAALRKAIGWGRYLESHARRLYAGVIEAPAVAARLLAARIQRGELPNPFAAREVYRNGWTGLDRDATESAIDLLLALHWLEERVEQTPGRAKTVYAINPKIQIAQGSQLTKLTEGAFVGSGSSPRGETANFVGREGDAA